MNFVDTTAYKEKRFKIVQNIDFNWDISKRFFNVITKS